ncbi:retrovirus-related pol polyprotein from transposon TNT 1-94 [Tanacetum coccineum]
MILESVEHGLLIWPTIEENGVIRTKKYEELFATEKILADCDLKATNIILQGLPSDVYSFVNHHRVAKDLGERVQLLMQVNTKFLNSLPPGWSKFVTDVKLLRDLHTTKFDQLHAYLEQHELHANEVRIMRKRNQDPLALIDSGLAVHVFKEGDDPIDDINKMMSFLSTVVSSRFPTTNNQLRNSSNPRQQETIHDRRVTVQPVQGRQSSFATGTSGTRANILGTGRNNSGQQRTVECFSCQGEGHMARQCPKPKRKRDATWFRDKVLLVEAQGSGKVLNEEELEFLADPGVAEGPATQTVITHNAAYQADDLDAYDSDYDDFSTAKAVLMANLSSYRPDVLSEDKNSSAQQGAMILSMFEQLSNQVTNCNKVNKDNLITNETLSAKLERFKERVKLLEERQNVDLSTREKLIMDDIIREKNAQFVDFEKEINYLKQTLLEISKEKELLTKTFNVFKNESKEKEAKNIDKEIALEKKVKELDNIFCKIALGFQNPFYLKKAQQIRPMLFDGSVIAKETNVISIADSEETLMLEEESRSKMLLKQNFGKRFIPQHEISDEQAFRLQTSYPDIDQSASSPVKIKAPRELPKVSLVNTSLKKLKYYLGQFDTVVKKQITPNALTKGE